MGGYKIIDLCDKNLITDGAGITINHIHEEIESNYRKAILLINITIDGVEKTDRFIAFQHANQEYKVLLDGKMLRINSDNLVKLTSSLT